MKAPKFTHLAPAPYAVIDYEYRQHGSACDHCGTFIKHVFIVEGSNGVRFQLGSQHVQEVGGSELSQTAKIVRKRVEDEAYRSKRQMERLQTEANRVAQIKSNFNANRSKIAKLPHPNDYFASKGKTMLDYLDYFRADLTKPIEAQEDLWWLHGKVNQVLRSLLSKGE
jgi:hypothetical protein